MIPEVHMKYIMNILFSYMKMFIYLNYIIIQKQELLYITQRNFILSILITLLNLPNDSSVSCPANQYLSCQLIK